MRLRYSPNFLAIFFILFFSAFALKDLAKPGFYTSHDGETHTARIAQYYQALYDGQLPPRWAKTLNGGLGSPIFVYIYPAPYFLGSLAHILGLSFVSSFKVLMAASFIASGIFSYLWLKEVFKRTSAAFIGAMFYTWAPYKFSLIYVRASLSEALAYAFLPLFLFAVARLAVKTNLANIAFSALTLSFFFLSQNLVVLMAAPVIFLYILVLAYLRKSVIYLFAAAHVFLWAGAISSVTYLPTFFERKEIHLQELFMQVYKSHFVTISQLIHSPWGYGFDLPGIVNDQISFQIGLAHILVVIAGVVILTYILVLKKVSFFKKLQELILENNLTGSDKILPAFFLIVFAVSVFLTLESPYSKFVWNTIKPLQLIDIPWRFLGIASLSAAFLAGFLAKIFKPRIFLLLMLAALLVANRNHLKINKSSFYDDNFFLNYHGSATQFNEFTPRTRYSTGVTDDFVSPVESIKGNIKIYDFNKKSNEVSFKTQNTYPARIQVNLIQFSGWRILMDGKNFTNDKSLVNKSFSFAYRPNVDTSGLYDLIVPAGNHQFTFKLEETKLRKTANYLSLSSFLLACVAIVLKRKRIVNF